MVFYGGLFPTQVGVHPAIYILRQGRKSFPHASGGRPDHVGKYMGFSQTKDELFPTQVGVHLQVFIDLGKFISFPHASGVSSVKYPIYLDALGQGVKIFIRVFGRQITICHDF